MLRWTTAALLPSIGQCRRKLGFLHWAIWLMNPTPLRLRNTKREDIAFIAFQLWVLGMSLVALLNESIPHMYVCVYITVLDFGFLSAWIQHSGRFHTPIRNGVGGFPNLQHRQVSRRLQKADNRRCLWNQSSTELLAVTCFRRNSKSSIQRGRYARFMFPIVQAHQSTYISDFEYHN